MTQQPRASLENFEVAQDPVFPKERALFRDRKSIRVGQNASPYLHSKKRDCATSTNQSTRMPQALKLTDVKDLALKPDLVTIQGILNRKK